MNEYVKTEDGKTMGFVDGKWTRICDLPECGLKHHSKGLCRKHWYQARPKIKAEPRPSCEYLDFDGVRCPTVPKLKGSTLCGKHLPCAFEGCDQPRYLGGSGGPDSHCAGHRTQRNRKQELTTLHERRGVDVDALEWIGQHLKVEDDPRHCWLWIRGCDDDGYGTIQIEGTRRRLHRYLWRELVDPDLPDDHDVDHIHEKVNPHCCRPDHLQAMPKRDHLRLTAERAKMLKGLQGLTAYDVEVRGLGWVAPPKDRTTFEVVEFASRHGLPFDLMGGEIRPERE